MFRSFKLNIFCILLLFAMLYLSQPAMSFLFYIPFVYCINLASSKKFLLNPYTLFSITIFSIIIYNPIFSSFLITIPNDIYLIIFLGIISFLLGMIIADKTGETKKSNEKINIRILQKKSFWIVLFLGIIPHFIGYINVGIPILNLENIAELRANYLPDGLSYFTFFLPLTILIAYQNKNKRLIIISIIINAVVSLIKVAKFDVLIFLMFILYSNIKYSQKTKISKNYLSTIGAVLTIPFIFDWFYSLRNDLDSVNSDYFLSNTDSFINSAVSLPYLYFTSSWSNLTQTISTVNEFNYGVYTLFPFISAFQMDHLINYYSIKTIYIHPFNTFAFLTDYYMDFGVIGVIIFPFLTGLLVMNAYKRSIISSNPIKDGQFLILGIATLMLFFSNHFTSVGYPFIVYILYGIIGRLIKVN